MSNKISECNRIAKTTIPVFVVIKVPDMLISDLTQIFTFSFYVAHEIVSELHQR